jgi:TRAP-type transport system small permease protein
MGIARFIFIIDEKINRFTEIIMIVATIIMILAMSTNIVLRYIFHRSPIWASELTSFIFVWIVFFGVSILTKREDHVTLEFIHNSKSTLIRNGAKLFSRLVSLFIAYLFITQGYTLVIMSMEQVSLDMRIPMGLVYLVIPICGVLMTIHTLVHFLRDMIKQDSNHVHC